ncbi:MAG: RNA-binding S4 domain-containing protein [Candidatus Berkiella sp.]
MSKATHSLNESPKVRLDKWLWAARFYKTRALAVKAIQQGRIRYEHQKSNPSRIVCVGAHITIETSLYEMSITVKALSALRQSAPLAQSLYQETPESEVRKQQALELHQKQKWMMLSAPVPNGKPNKHDRQAIKALKRGSEE